MNFEIREMKTEDIDGKAYVHFKSWHESYNEIFPKEYLEKQSLEHCIKMAKTYPSNTYVLEDKEINKIVGFLCVNGDGEIGEITAIYILDEYKGKNIGNKLLEYGLELLRDKNEIELYVLSDNKRAINFYKKYNFKEKEEKYYKKELGIKVTRMLLKRGEHEV